MWRWGPPKTSGTGGIELNGESSLRATGTWSGDISAAKPDGKIPGEWEEGLPGHYEITKPPPQVQHSQHSSTHGPRQPKSQHLTPGVYSHDDKIIPGEAQNAWSRPHDWSMTRPEGKSAWHVGWPLQVTTVVIPSITSTHLPLTTFTPSPAATWSLQRYHPREGSLGLWFFTGKEKFPLDDDLALNRA